jgi:hypothetical protein
MQVNLLNYQEQVISEEHLPTFSNIDYNVVRNFSLFSGFAENHNLIASHLSPCNEIILLNPDCIPNKDSISKMLDLKYSKSNIAIVEARQWPYEHPKYYNSKTFETSWASFAFVLLDFKVFSKLGGICEEYFMYVEDVDYSWRCRLAGKSVLYCSDAVGLHFSTGSYSRFGLPSLQERLGPRNFLLLAHRFFDPAGIKIAEGLLMSRHGKDALKQAKRDLKQINLIQLEVASLRLNSHEWIDIFDYNRFNKMTTR